MTYQAIMLLTGPWLYNVQRRGKRRARPSRGASGPHRPSRAAARCGRPSPPAAAVGQPLNPDKRAMWFRPRPAPATRPYFVRGLGVRGAASGTPLSAKHRPYEERELGARDGPWGRGRYPVTPGGRRRAASKCPPSSIIPRLAVFCNRASQKLN